MKLEWMGEYRDVIDGLIHYCNIYAAAYKAEKMEYNGVFYSFSQIQVVEYILESEERKESMSAIASRLGISRSNFTKIVNRLISKGLLEKNHLPGNRKNYNLSVTPLGRELYEQYSKEILRWHFSPMFNKLSHIPREYYPFIHDALYDAMGGDDCEELNK